MILTKDGITIEVSHPSDIARYKHLGYKEPEKVKPVEVKPEEQAIAQPVASEPDQQVKDQATVEEVLQPEKKGKVKK